MEGIDYDDYDHSPIFNIKWVIIFYILTAALFISLFFTLDWFDMSVVEVFLNGFTILISLIFWAVLCWIIVFFIKEERDLIISSKIRELRRLRKSKIAKNVKNAKNAKNVMLNVTLSVMLSD
jgi:hypothetical protein